MKKKVLINEEQLKKIMEYKANEYNVIDVAKQLKNIKCDGSGVKPLVTEKLRGVGYTDIKINFIGYEDETNKLMYSIYTDGPMFIIKAESMHQDKPCMQITFVQAYEKLQSKN
jgi:hypothetical protein